MASKLQVARQKPHPFFLRLNEQQFVEWILVFKRVRKLRSGVMGSERQELPIDCRGKRHHRAWIKRPLPRTGDMEAVPLEA